MSRASHAARLERLKRQLRGEPVVRVVCADWLRAMCLARSPRCHQQCEWPVWPATMWSVTKPAPSGGGEAEAPGTAPRTAKEPER